MNGEWSCVDSSTSGKPHTLRDRQGRTPLVTQDVQANAAICVDVGVVDPGGELDLWRLERVVGGKHNRQEEDAVRVWGLALSRDDQRL